MPPGPAHDGQREPEQGVSLHGRRAEVEHPERHRDDADGRTEGKLPAQLADLFRARGILGVQQRFARLLRPRQLRAVARAANGLDQTLWRGDLGIVRDGGRARHEVHVGRGDALRALERPLHSTAARGARHPGDRDGAGLVGCRQSLRHGYRSFSAMMVPRTMPMPQANSCCPAAGVKLTGVVRWAGRYVRIPKSGRTTSSVQVLVSSRWKSSRTGAPARTRMTRGRVAALHLDADRAARPPGRCSPHRRAGRRRRSTS